MSEKTSSLSDRELMLGQELKWRRLESVNALQLFSSRSFCSHDETLMISALRISLGKKDYSFAHEFYNFPYCSVIFSLQYNSTGECEMTSDAFCSCLSTVTEKRGLACFFLLLAKELTKVYFSLLSFSLLNLIKGV